MNKTHTLFFSHNTGVTTVRLSTVLITTHASMCMDDLVGERNSAVKRKNIYYC